MYRRTKTLFISKTVLDGLLGAFQAVPGAALLDGAKVRLFTNNLQLGNDTVPDDLTIPTFGSYDDIDLPDLTGPSNDATNGRAMEAQVDWIADAPPSGPESVTGYAIIDSGATKVLAGELFEVPVGISGAGDPLYLQVVLPLPYQVETAEE